MRTSGNGMSGAGSMVGRVVRTEVITRLAVVAAGIQLLAATPALADLNTGLVGYYSLDGNANDASAYANHGTIYGNLPFVEHPPFGMAGHFVPLGTYYAEIPHQPQLVFSDSFSIHFWYRPTQLLDSGRVLQKHIPTDHTHGYTWDIVHNPANRLVFYHCWPGGSSNARCVCPIPLIAGTWHHIVYTYSLQDNVFRGYLNGALVAAELAQHQVVPMDTTLSILAMRDRGGYRSEGDLDELRIYNRALSASEVRQLYGLGISAPTITVSPQSCAVAAGMGTNFSVSAASVAPVGYQWRKDGLALPGKTDGTLSLPAVSTTDAGYYWVVVTNVAGTATSARARLAVLETRGTQGQLDPGVLPAKGVGKDSLVFVTHGWRKLWDSGDFGWVDTMANAITTYVNNAGLSNWQVMGYHWAGAYGSWTADPETARAYGVIRGALLGQAIKAQGWTHVHLIGHSAGAALIQAIASALVGSGTSVHTTFLDPYTGPRLDGRAWYGQASSWSDDYFAKDPLLRLNDVGTGVFTEGKLTNSHNVDVTLLDPDGTTVPKLCEVAGGAPGGTSMYQCGYVAAHSTHEWPHKFYLRSITNGFPNHSNYGFARSKEGGGWDDNYSYPVNNDPVVLGDTSTAFDTSALSSREWSVQPDSLPRATGGNVTLNSTSLLLDATEASPGPVEGNESKDSSGAAAWISMGLTVTNPANAVQFEAAFTSGGPAQGALLVYWNTNEIGLVDERVGANGLQAYTFALPSLEVDGIHALEFRLDAYTAAGSSLLVTNLRTTWISLASPDLAMATDTNTHLPMLTISGFPGAGYLVESSTNLNDWAAVGVFSSTNATMRYADPTGGTNGQRYFRASPW